LVYALHSREEFLALFGVGKHLQLERQLHYDGVYHSLQRKATRDSSAA
jgi:hypothetical protein